MLALYRNRTCDTLARMAENSGPATTTSKHLHQQVDDAALIARILSRDQGALLLLYERYGSQVYSLTLRVLRDPMLAEEATQDTFVKVWNKGEQWDPYKGRLSSWLLTIARFTAIDRLRREQRHSTQAMDLLDALPSLEASYGRVGDRLWQDGQLLRSLMAQLPEEQAQVIELAFFQGMTHSELAQHLDWPLGTVKTRVRLGLQKLRALWREATE